MTALETSTTASKQPLTTGRRPDMTAICASGPKAGVDVKWILQIVDGKETGRSKPTLQTTSHRIDLDGLVKLMERRGFYAGLFEQGQAIARDFAHLT